MAKMKKMTPGTFIRKMFTSLQGRYKEHVIQNKLSQGLLLKPAPPVDGGEPQESWMRKQTTFLAKKSKFYSAPNRVPVPHKKKGGKKEAHHFCLKREKQDTACDPCNVPPEVPVSEKEYFYYIQYKLLKKHYKQLSRKIILSFM